MIVLDQHIDFSERNINTNRPRRKVRNIVKHKCKYGKDYYYYYYY